MPSYSMKSFTMLLVAQSISMFGTSLTGFALGVWVFEQVGSTTIYVMIALANAIPLVLLSPLAGAIVDRINRKLVILGSQIASFMVTAVLILLFSMDMLQPWHIIALVALNSVFLAFVLPAITATIPLMVPKEKLIQANGMIALATGVIQLASPAISGSLYHSVGLDTIFIIDLCTYVITLLTIVFTFIPQPCPLETAKNKSASLFLFLKEGWIFLQAHKGLEHAMLFYSITVSLLLGMSIMIQPMILAFSTPQTLGYIMSTAGVGMLFGSLIMIALNNINRHMPMILVATLIAGLIASVAPLSTSPWVLAMCGFLILSCFPVYDANNRALLQRKVDANMIGRIIGLRNFALGIGNGVVLIGSGLLSDYVLTPAMQHNTTMQALFTPLYGEEAGRGIAITISLLGLCTIAIGLAATFTKRIRQLDVDMPDVETPVMEDDVILKYHPH